MDCFCGCGRRVPRNRTEASIRLGEISLELLAWDRFRSREKPAPDVLEEVDGLIDRGTIGYRHLLAAVHGEREDASLAESDEWLRESRAAWSQRPTMTERGSFLLGKKLRLTEEDFARLDRLDPGHSFSAVALAEGPPLQDNLVDELERLGTLLTEGLLTEDEFRAAKAKLLRR